MLCLVQPPGGHQKVNFIDSRLPAFLTGKLVNLGFFHKEDILSPELSEKKRLFYLKMTSAAIEAINSIQIKNVFLVKNFNSHLGKTERIVVEDFTANKFKSLYIVAQRRLENGFRLQAPGNNPFNIKGTGDAGSITLNTHEYVKGVKIYKCASFARYTSDKAGIEDYLNQLKRNFPKAFDALRDDSLDHRDFTSGLVKGKIGPYATAPNYSWKFGVIFRNVIRDYEDMLHYEINRLNLKINFLYQKILNKCVAEPGVRLIKMKIKETENEVSELQNEISTLCEFKENEGV